MLRAGMSKLAALLILAVCAALPSARAAADPIPAGSGQQTATIDGTALRLFTYRPAGCAPSALLVVFHGLHRNASGYRDYAIPVAKKLCLLVVAPLFDEGRFPSWSYQRGGIVRGGKVQPAGSRTVDIVPRLVAWVRAAQETPSLPYSLIGFSAGAQFLSRVAAFIPTEATRIVIADPSTWVEPRLDTPAPYGFGPPYPSPEGEAALRRYLALPITVIVGGADIGAKNLAESDEAQDQGPTRLARGQNAFQQAEQTARQHGWPFTWKMAVVPGVAHSAPKVLASDQVLTALRP
jgi:dienelactone hydrolase